MHPTGFHSLPQMVLECRSHCRRNIECYFHRLSDWEMAINSGGSDIKICVSNAIEIECPSPQIHVPLQRGKVRPCRISHNAMTSHRHAISEKPHRIGAAT